MTQLLLLLQWISVGEQLQEEYVCSQVCFPAEGDRLIPSPCTSPGPGGGGNTERDLPVSEPNFP